MELREENTYIFRVVFRKGPKSLPKTIKKEAYNLIIGKSKLSLRNIASNEICLEWPYNCIKRFGMTSNTFKVETGRRSKTGKGIFVMETMKVKEIMDKVFEMIEQIKSDRRNSKTKTAQTNNLYSEPYTLLPYTRKDETLRGEVLELKSNAPRPDGPSTANVGLGSEATVRTRSKLGPSPGSEHECTYDDGEALALPLFPHTTFGNERTGEALALPLYPHRTYGNECTYDDGEAWALVGSVANDILDERKHGESTRIGHKGVTVEGSTEDLRGQAGARQVQGGIIVPGSPKGRSKKPRPDYENVKFLRK